MKLLIHILFLSNLFAQIVDLSGLEPGKRGDDDYRVWVYFDERDQKSTIDLDPATIKRRVKHGIHGPTKYDYIIKSSYLSDLNKTGVEIKNKSRWLNAVSVIADLDQIFLIKQFPFVLKIEPVQLHKKKKGIQSNKTHSQVRDLDYGSSLDQIDQINCRTPHIAGYHGQGVRVLYLDTGFELNHEAYDSLNLIAEYDFINNDENTANETPEEVSDDQDGHGTICLSVMAGYSPGNLIGPAFKSDYLLAKTEVMADEIYQEVDNYVAAIEWGESLGADITCASLGYYDWYTYNDLDGNTAATTIAVDIASSLGVLCVNSAGNEGDDPWYYICTPADADSIISVGAVSQDGTIAGFSSRGPTYDGRIKPEVCARGVSTFCVRSNTEDIYRTASGTSFSAPLAAGAAAVIMSANPDWTNMHVREAMMMTASQGNNPDNSYGYGIINTWGAINYQHTSSIESNDIIANDIKVNKAYPNPFNPIVSMVIESSTAESLIKTSVYDLQGRLVETLYNKDFTEKILQLYWDATDYPNGIYFIYTYWSGGSDLQKITLLK